MQFIGRYFINQLSETENLFQNKVTQKSVKHF